MRFKKRYIVYEIESCHQFYAREIVHALQDAIQTFYGDYGLAVVQKVIYVKYFDNNSNTLIIVAPRKHYRMVQSAGCFIKQIKNKEASLRTIHVGGTIKSCKKFLLAQRYQTLPHTLLECRSHEEREKVKAEIYESCSGILTSQLEVSNYRSAQTTTTTTRTT